MKVPRRSPVFLAFLAASFPFLATAQDRTLVFDTSAPGVDRSIRSWGFDVTWADWNRSRLSAMHMGSHVNVVRIPFLPIALVNGQLTTAHTDAADWAVTLANMAPGADLTMSAGTGGEIDPWYKNGSEIIPGRWVELMEATAQYVASAHGKTIVSTEPFNEPDWAGWRLGTEQNLYDICNLLQASAVFAETDIAGASVLNVD